MVKAVLFDFWGTLVNNGTYSPIRQTFKILRLRMQFGEYVERLERSLMTKPFKDQVEGFKAVCEEFNVEPEPEVIDRLVGVWNKNKLLASIYPETIEVLEKLKQKKLKLAIISNTHAFSIESVIEKFDLAKYFDVIVLSYEHGFLKTDKELFDIVFKKLKIKPKDAVMVGDSIQTDIKGAENAGIKPILVDRMDRREFPNKITTLSELPEMIK
jgi:putative hydrolase of the HAD superfamily